MPRGGDSDFPSNTAGVSGRIHPSVKIAGEEVPRTNSATWVSVGKEPEARSLRHAVAEQVCSLQGGRPVGRAGAGPGSLPLARRERLCRESS